MGGAWINGQPLASTTPQGVARKLIVEYDHIQSELDGPLDTEKAKSPIVVTVIVASTAPPMKPIDASEHGVK
jgi:hypothetical protein